MHHFQTIDMFFMNVIFLLKKNSKMKFEFPKIVSLDILYSCLIVIKILIKTKANELATGKSIQELSPTIE